MCENDFHWSSKESQKRQMQGFADYQVDYYEEDDEWFYFACIFIQTAVHRRGDSKNGGRDRKATGGLQRV